AVTGHRALHFRRRVLEHRYARLDCGEHGDAARVPELQRAADVDREEQVFDRHRRRLAFGEQRSELVVDPLKLVGERLVRLGGDRAADDDAVARPVGFDAPITGAFAAGVDAEHSHASDASISFSEMSKFDHTCCTSSCSSSASISLTIWVATLPSSLT